MDWRTRTTTNDEEIRRWVEEHGGKPAMVRDTGSSADPGIRIDFPGGAGEEALEHIEWNDWLQTFQQSNLAFLYQEEAGGGDSTFFKLLRRDG